MANGMMWSDVACIVFICVCANHLGLVSAIEDVIKHKLPIVNCVKCFSFWFSFVYCIFTHTSVIHTLATSFLCSYLSIWLELGFGFIDSIFNKAYGKIYQSEGADFEDSTNSGELDT